MWSISSADFTCKTLFKLVPKGTEKYLIDCHGSSLAHSRLKSGQSSVSTTKLRIKLNSVQPTETLSVSMLYLTFLQDKLPLNRIVFVFRIIYIILAIWNYDRVQCQCILRPICTDLAKI